MSPGFAGRHPKRCWVSALEVGEHQDVEQLGAGNRTERVQAHLESARRAARALSLATDRIGEGWSVPRQSELASPKDALDVALRRPPLDLPPRGRSRHRRIGDSPPAGLRGRRSRGVHLLAGTPSAITDPLLPQVVGQRLGSDGRDLVLEARPAAPPAPGSPPGSGRAHVSAAVRHPAGLVNRQAD